MALADINQLTKRFNRILFTTDSYVVALSNPPKRKSFNSDTEIADILLEADELLCLDVRGSIGHPFAPTFFTLSAALVNGDKIPASDAPIHKVTWSTTTNGTYIDSEESDKADIIEAVKAVAASDFTTFGPAADTYGYHIIIGGQLYTTNPFTKVTQAPWTRTSALQGPQSYSTGILCTAIALAPKDGLDTNLLNYCEKRSEAFRAMIRQGAMILPEVTQFGLSEVAG